MPLANLVKTTKETVTSICRRTTVSTNFWNLYHLNAEEEPENRDYPGDMKLANGKTFRETYGPRGVIKASVQPDGTQSIQDTGALTKKRMETVDEETLAAAKDFITRKSSGEQPFFVWWNATRMHFRTHVKEEHKGISGPDGDEYHDGMVEHDRHVGELLDLLDQLNLSENTIVIYSTDNGPHYNTWPDAGTTPFVVKEINWEGAYRVPAFVRWPQSFPSWNHFERYFLTRDWLPTLAGFAGDSEIKEKLKAVWN